VPNSSPSQWVRRGLYGAFRSKVWAIGVAQTPLADWVQTAIDHGAVPEDDFSWFSRTRQGEFVADPMVIEWDREPWLLFESFDPWHGRGSIGTARIVSGSVVAESIAIANRHHHLAYPFVFKYGNRVLCVPDCSAHDGLHVFEAVSPRRWSHLGTLSGVPHLRDPTLIQQGDNWWLYGLFRSRKAPPLIRRFFAADPFALWKEGRPIPAHDLMRRPAGKFIRLDNRLIRPAQDSRTAYGGGVCLFETSDIGNEGHPERLITALKPGVNWPYRDGFHTLVGNGSVTVVDACRNIGTPFAGVFRVIERYHRIASRARPLNGNGEILTD
jgi:hypothetical protein